MKIGFIGAGKAGVCLGRYFFEKGINISGYFSKTLEHAKIAADYTRSAVFLSLEEVVLKSDIILVTTWDSVIEKKWEDLRTLNIRGKLVAHCSGALSSRVFQGAEVHKVEVASIHPVQALSGEKDGYKALENTCFTLEGTKSGVSLLSEILNKTDNEYFIIGRDDKEKYHASTVMASNLVVGLMNMAMNTLGECGISKDKALKLLGPLAQGNMKNICEIGPEKALTGPVERGDLDTIKKHVKALEGNVKEVYTLLSMEDVNIAHRKNSDNKYDELKFFLKETKNEKHSSNI